MLATVILRKQKQESQLEEARFERDMFINNPSMYNEYMKRKNDTITQENEGVVWKTPDSIEEFHELDKILKKSQELSDEPTAEELSSFVKQVSSMNFDTMDLFNNIDIDQIGDEA
jgi:hypothetical protein